MSTFISTVCVSNWILSLCTYWLPIATVANFFLWVLFAIACVGPPVWCEVEITPRLLPLLRELAPLTGKKLWFVDYILLRIKCCNQSFHTQLFDHYGCTIWVLTLHCILPCLSVWMHRDTALALLIVQQLKGSILNSMTCMLSFSLSFLSQIVQQSSHIGSVYLLCNSMTLSIWFWGSDWSCAPLDVSLCHHKSVALASVSLDEMQSKP